MLRNPIRAALKARKRSRHRKQGRPLTAFSRHNRLLFEPLESRVLLDASAALLRPTELQYWDTTNAYNGYNFYGASGTSYLLDMDGRVVHTWPLGTNPHLLTAAEGYGGGAGDVLDFMNGSSPSGVTGLEEVNWSGSVVWSYTNTRSNYHLHHDFERIYDPDLGGYTTIFIANKDYTYAQCVAAGANPTTTPSTGARWIRSPKSTRAVISSGSGISSTTSSRTNTRPKGTMPAPARRLPTTRANWTSTCLAIHSRTTGCTATRWTSTSRWTRS